MTSMLVPGEVRPMPRPSWLSAPFWEAAAAGELKVQRCGACGRCFFRPEAACPSCQSEQWAWELMSGRAAVYSYSVVERAAIPGMAVPYAIADVLLDEGVHMMTNIIGCSPGDIAIGLRVQVQFVRIADLSLPFFRPEEV